MSKLLLKPLPYQLADVEEAERRGGRVLLGWSMGLGKTVGALLYLHRNPEARPAAVLCPAGLKWNWEAIAKRHFGMRADVLSGCRPPRGGFRSPRKLVIVNYEILSPGQHGPGWLEWLRALGLRALICDEVQMLGNPKSKRTRSTRQLSLGVPHLLMLSGTPLLNRPAELWPTLNMLDPREFRSQYEYYFRYCGPRKTPWRWDFSGASNLPELHERLKKTVLLRRRTEDVLKDLPPKRRSVVPLELSDPAEYRRASADFLSWLRKLDPGKARRAARAEAISKLGELKRLAARLKLPAVFSWVDGFLRESDGKLILFAVHRSLIREVAERYAKACVVVDGSVVGKRRQRAVEQFLGNPRTRLFIGNIKAAGVGWSARGVSDVAFAELSWTPGEHVQAEDRCHGIGRGAKGVSSNAYYLVARGTVEERLAKLLQTKQKILNATLDGRGRGDRLAVFDQLLSSLGKEGGPA